MPCISSFDPRCPCPGSDYISCIIFDMVSGDHPLEVINHRKRITAGHSFQPDNFHDVTSALNSSLVSTYHNLYIRPEKAGVKYPCQFLKIFRFCKIHHAARPLQKCEFRPGQDCQSQGPFFGRPGNIPRHGKHCGFSKFLRQDLSANGNLSSMAA